MNPIHSLLSVLTVCCVGLGTHAAEQRLISPDGKLAVIVSAESELRYRVEVDGQPLVKPAVFSSACKTVLACARSHPPEQLRSGEADSSCHRSDDNSPGRTRSRPVLGCARRSDTPTRFGPAHTSRSRLAQPRCNVSLYDAAADRDNSSLVGETGRRICVNCIDFTNGQVQWVHRPVPWPTFVVAGDKLLIQTLGGELILAAASPEGYREYGRQRDSRRAASSCCTGTTARATWPKGGPRSRPTRIRRSGPAPAARGSWVTPWHSSPAPEAWRSLAPRSPERR